MTNDAELTFTASLYTDGTGLWSDKATKVTVTGMYLGYVDEEQSFGELRVTFDPDSWDVSEDGLIYTDPQFLMHLHEILFMINLSPVDVSYSEQGMQGRTYVSLDVGEEFLNSWHIHSGNKNI